MKEQHNLERIAKVHIGSSHGTVYNITIFTNIRINSESRVSRESRWKKFKKSYLLQAACGSFSCHARSLLGSRLIIEVGKSIMSLTASSLRLVGGLDIRTDTSQGGLRSFETEAWFIPDAFGGGEKVFPSKKYSPPYRTRISRGLLIAYTLREEFPPQIFFPPKI